MEDLNGTREEFFVDEICTYRYAAENPDYAMLIVHGGGGWGGMYDKFCYPFNEERNVDIWALDLPGFGDTGQRGVFTAEEQHAVVARLAREIKARTGVPLFCLGSSMGGYYASAASFLDDVDAVICSATHMFCDGPGKALGQGLFESDDVARLMRSPTGTSLMLDLDLMIDWEKNYGDQEHAKWVVAHPKHASQILFSSWISLFSWQPPAPLSENTKPFLFLVAEADPLVPLKHARKGFDYIGGPNETVVFPTDQHQVMLFHTGPYSDALDEWCRRQIANGFNAGT